MRRPAQPRLRVADRVEEERRVGRHVVAGPGGALLQVEQRVDQRRSLASGPDEEESGDHAPHLVPEKRRPVDDKDPRSERALVVVVGGGGPCPPLAGEACPPLARPAHGPWRRFDWPHLEGGDAAHERADVRVELAEVAVVVLADESARSIAHRCDVELAAREEVVVPAHPHALLSHPSARLASAAEQRPRHVRDVASKRAEKSAATGAHETTRTSGGSTRLSTRT
mmetsp:Transcript_36505/g.117963  ORF Transcript_36505/g.117963 Transcript_36505/m.117963 type:complete len:226 (-) Transcript_36505:15-692(-)